MMMNIQKNITVMMKNQNDANSTESEMFLFGNHVTFIIRATLHQEMILIILGVKMIISNTDFHFFALNVSLMVRQKTMKD